MPTWTRRRKRFIAGVAILLIAPAAIWAILVSAGFAPKPGGAMFPPFNMSDRVWELPIEGDVQAEGLRIVYGENEYSPEQFLAEVQRRQQNARGIVWVFAVLDITSWTSLWWVVFGLLAQVIFAGRMIVQWIAAERVRAAVVPPLFWWMSLVGSSMLVVYFIWRVEVIGILGQATGWFVYVRNLWFIYGKPR